MPVVLRSGTAPAFTYTDSSGKKITSAAILDYIKSLRIPPAYTQVKIHIATKGDKVCAPVKLTYTGVDTANRTQYGYSAAHKTRAAKEKFGDLIAFGLTLPKIRARLAEILKDPSVTREPTLEVATALILRIVLLCHFRLGNAKYRQLYKSYGVTTLEVRHLKFVEPTAVSRIKVPSAKFDFIGKKHIANSCCITEPDVVAHLRNMVAGRGPKEPIFVTSDNTEVKAADVNVWLKQFDVDLSSKRFRTYAASTMMIYLLNAHAHRNKKVEMPESMTITDRKRAINAALDIASATIHNTRSVCKSSYTHPLIMELYLNHPRKYASAFMRPGVDAETAFVQHLISISKKGEPAAMSAEGGDASAIWFDEPV